MIYVLEAIFGMAGEWIVGNYLKLMTAISPRFKFKKLIYVFLGIIFITFVSGLACIFTEDALLKTIGIYAVAISLGIITVNVVLGIVLKIIERNKK